MAKCSFQLKHDGDNYFCTTYTTPHILALVTSTDVGTVLNCFGTVRYSSKLNDKNGYVYSNRYMTIMQLKIGNNTFSKDASSVDNFNLLRFAYENHSDNEKVKTALSAARLEQKMLQAMSDTMDKPFPRSRQRLPLPKMPLTPPPHSVQASESCPKISLLTSLSRRR